MKHEIYGYRSTLTGAWVYRASLKGQWYASYNGSWIGCIKAVCLWQGRRYHAS